MSEGDSAAAAMIFVLGLFIGAVVGLAIGHHCGVAETQRKAVQAGVAFWHADKAGNAVLSWDAKPIGANRDGPTMWVPAPKLDKN